MMHDSLQPHDVSVDLINSQILGKPGLHTLQIRDGVVKTIATKPDPAAAVIDVGGDWISLGGIDLQINGGLGLAFPELTGENHQQLQGICEYLWHQGVDGFLPTIVTTTVEKFRRSLAILGEFQGDRKGEAAEILGVHLEGPFLNEQKRGAHPENCLLPLTIDNVKRVLGDYEKVVKVMTLAPELDPTKTVIPYLRSLGIIVSLGHSQANLAVANEAFNQGATMVTHAFNAMPPLHHREPGLLGAALCRSEVFCGAIADGHHVCPTMLDLLLRGSKGEIFVVSDALAPLGLADGVYPWDERRIEVTGGVARLEDGTLAGTTLSLLRGAENLVRWGICSAAEAIALVTETPRRAIALSTEIIGQPITRLLRWREDQGCLRGQRLRIGVRI
ncbi:N-acetylglucosamine-6-phosphate deacetylase [Arthrospira platensis FACHB-971]|nr:N-acetylglucosamine-6-phosphate deacetylase [Arthrospira platensis]AMW28044.1 N-acetylglucosamine-6-phosphate deacetylase [Arthrospira platensis YZ]KDR57168.1 N-acetylglucosamine-6-phosphate deacetylase [Arthrospira platensis str. Paraca]MBD2668785.1 N-acetylglucosamine-6-phosphate deacetylase [Arthrospira platensis FACHB-439]MBD2710152.1 N-acetylglucosamine-6-phosphate deacetylase [Arthrospira platensis FACHB-835]MDT9184752.1 N-acetylglucosamine-6-phosphate deacetylase [Limnospira sp. PMC 